MNFSATVKAALEQRGMKQKDLADQVGYSYQYISELISGKKRWNEVAIDNVCRALNLSVNFTLNEEEEESGKEGGDA
jgi:transcriptional regulator with XRE-family HTH domain